jgi:hypothetical protein
LQDLFLHMYFSPTNDWECHQPKPLR